ncbi:MAG: beta/gamma crystallin-related protein [Alphaproteobacteria bacterium]
MRSRLRSALAAFAAALALTVFDSAPASAQPAGSYLQSCTNAHIGRGGRLVADCLDRRGRYQRSALDYRACRGDIWNRDGQLACRVGGGPPGPPPSAGERGPRGSITLYSGPGYSGRGVTFQGPVPDLRAVGFNNRADSANIRGRWASWELCTRTNFRGRCIVVRGDVPSLRQLGMDDQISSLRPLN